MTVTLPSSLESFVLQKVASGAYQNASEVVGESLALLQQHDRWNAMTAAKIDEGMRDIEHGRVLSMAESEHELRAIKAGWRAGA